MYKKKWHINFIILLSFLLGILIAIQIKNATNSDGLLSTKSIADLQVQVNAEAMEIENKGKLVLEKKVELLRYEKELQDTGSILTLMEEDRQGKMLMAGISSVKGEGVIVSMSDSSKELMEGQNPNDLIIHDQDVLHIINDLKIAGAEALSINGQRVSSLSEIKCNGPTITINEKTYGQPFIITAIGNKENLHQIIQHPDSYSNLLKSVYGIDIKVESKDEINMSGYGKMIKFQFLKEAS